MGRFYKAPKMTIDPSSRLASVSALTASVSALTGYAVIKRRDKSLTCYAVTGHRNDPRCAPGGDFIVAGTFDDKVQSARQSTPQA